MYVWKSMKKSTLDKKKIKKIRNLVIFLIFLLIVIKLNKTVFFFTIFSVIAYIGKYIRGMFGLKMVVFDPLHFFTIMIARFIGIKEAILYVAVNTLIIDFLTFIASDGTFANFFFYSGTSVLSVMLFGNLNIVIYVGFAGIMYSILYFLYRTLVVPNAPFEVISKCITSLLFSVLYASFLGPLLAILMSV